MSCLQRPWIQDMIMGLFRTGVLFRLCGLMRPTSGAYRAKHTLKP